MKIKPDEYYITETLNGHVNAYAFLVEKYKHMIFTLTIKIVKNREDAEEISQDTFVKAFKNLEYFKGDSKFSTWLYKIAYYASLDVVKRNKRMVKFETIENFKDVDYGTMEDVLKNLHEKERRNVINLALQKLNNDEQTILTLYYFDNLPIKEISKVVNLSEENIKVKLFRSRKKLASILKNVIEPRTIDLV
jgi:RNA polymerase sigma-70 factor (ECF subfamily)